MNTRKRIAAALGAAIVLALLTILPVGPSGATAQERRDGRTLFETTYDCSKCHAVPLARIEAKATSDRMKGADLGGRIQAEFAQIAAYMRGETDRLGRATRKRHSESFKGTDEELQAIIDWLGSLE